MVYAQQKVPERSGTSRGVLASSSKAMQVFTLWPFSLRPDVIKVYGLSGTIRQLHGVFHCWRNFKVPENGT